MDIMELLATRRTYRRFQQTPVPAAVVDDMIQAVRLSSCGGNRQAIRLVVVQSPEMVARVQPLVKWAAYLPPEQGTPGPGEQPVLFVAVVQDASIPGDKDTDAGIALANLTLAAWARGVSMCSTRRTTAPTSTGPVWISWAVSSRVRVSSFSVMRVSRSASSPMSVKNSRAVSPSMCSA